MERRQVMAERNRCEEKYDDKVCEAGKDALTCGEGIALVNQDVRLMMTC